MTTEGYDYSQRRRTPGVTLTARQFRDLLAAVLLLAGAGGVIAVVWIACPLAGWGVLAALAAVAGVALGLDR